MPVARALQSHIDETAGLPWTLKVQLAPKAEPQAPAGKKTAHELLGWPGEVIGGLDREDVYADIGGSLSNLRLEIPLNVVALRAG